MWWWQFCSFNAENLKNRKEKLTVFEFPYFSVTHERTWGGGRCWWLGKEYLLLLCLHHFAFTSFLRHFCSSSSPSSPVILSFFHQTHLRPLFCVRAQCGSDEQSPFTRSWPVSSFSWCLFFCSSSIRELMLTLQMALILVPLFLVQSIFSCRLSSSCCLFSQQAHLLLPSCWCSSPSSPMVTWTRMSWRCRATLGLSGPSTAAADSMSRKSLKT